MKIHRQSILTSSLALWLAVLTASCSTTSTSDAGPNGDADAGEGTDHEDQVCGSQEFQVGGRLDGVPVSEQVTVAGHALVNVPGDTGCYLNVYFQGGGRLRLEWDDTLAEGETSPASGSVNLEAAGGINAGNCKADGHASEMTLLANGVSFVLRQLRAAPYCQGVSVSGELQGCASFD